MARAACSSLSCASSSSSTAIGCRAVHKYNVRDTLGTKGGRRTFFHSAWSSRGVDWCAICTHQPVVQLILLQLIQLRLEFILEQRCMSGSDSICNNMILTSSISVLPFGVEIKSAIS